MFSGLREGMRTLTSHKKINPTNGKAYHRQNTLLQFSDHGPATIKESKQPSRASISIAVDTLEPPDPGERSLGLDRVHVHGSSLVRSPSH